MASAEQLALAARWDDLTILRTGIRFTQRVGRPPRRMDFRSPHREAWEEQLALELPTADQAAARFGSWGEYLARMGYGPHQLGSVENHLIEQAGIAHVQDAYPEFEVVEAEQNAFDGYLGSERVEVKASMLTRRVGRERQLYWAFKTHSRVFSKTVDRVLLVGLGLDRSAQVIRPLVRFEFQGVGLRQLDGKSTVMVYTGGVFGPNHSIYRPHIRWRATGVANRLPELARLPEESVTLNEVLEDVPEPPPPLARLRPGGR